MFGIFHKRSKQADIIGRLRKCSDVESFTSAFIVQVVRSKITPVRVRRSDGLPKVETTFGETLTPDYEKVANRLKVCSMLDPVRYAEPVSGSFGCGCPGKDGQVSQFRVETYFDDREPDPFFEVRIAKDAS